MSTYENPRGFSIWFVFANLVAETRNEIIHKTVVKHFKELKEIYLSENLKHFYLNDFEKLLTADNDFWKIEESIKGYLIKINSKPKIQTLYSKDGQNDFLSVSSLDLCYVKELEPILFKIVIPKIQLEFNKLRNSCHCNFSYPRNNENFIKNRLLGFSCTDNEDHFRINHFRINFKSRNGTEHNKFWDYITNKLIKI